MATELLERTVIPSLKDHDVPFQTPSDNVVQCRLPHKFGAVDIKIIDQKIGLLTIYMFSLVRPATGQEANATTMCNVLNQQSLGTFLIDKSGDVTYRLDFPATETAGPSEADHVFSCALSMFEKMYPVIMAVRWANATVEEALEQTEDGGPGAPIIDIGPFLPRNGPGRTIPRIG